MIAPFRRTRFETGCRIEVEQTDERVCAHVELDGDLVLRPGDQVRVHGAAVRVPFGGRLVERRTATVTRATAVERAWVRLVSRFELTELYEVSFSPGRAQ
jgi:hypothetical protein